jgi:hypothetical protein
MEIRSNRSDYTQDGVYCPVRSNGCIGRLPPFRGLSRFPYHGFSSVCKKVSYPLFLSSACILLLVCILLDA